MALRQYRKKRDFRKTSEPTPRRRRRVNSSTRKARTFVVHEHYARRHHFDLRLEFGGTLKSWAVPKEPSFDPGEKRLAVHVEDHPLEYGKFQGTIPKGQYGAGKVTIWDKGTWEPSGTLGVRAALQKGHLSFVLYGKKLQGSWNLVRMSKSDTRDNWLLVKARDEYARYATQRAKRVS